jgi:uncharacterized protein (DUF1330 family)
MKAHAAKIQDTAATKEGSWIMKTNLKLMFAVLVGVAMGSLAGVVVRGQQINTAPGYLIAEVEITDPGKLQNYAQKVEGTLAPFNHHFIVRTSKIQTLEGDVPTNRMVIIAFDSVVKAREWYDSPAYAAIRPIRESAAKSHVYIVEGLPPR